MVNNFSELSIVSLILTEIIILIIINVLISFEKKRDEELFDKNKDFDFEDKFRFWKLYIIPAVVFLIVLFEIFNRVYNYIYFNQ